MTETDTPGRRRRAWTAIIAAVVVGFLAGCSTTPSSATTSPAPDSDPATAAHAFLRAIGDGKFATALALSTSSGSEFACDWMIEDGQSGGLAAPVVNSVEVDGSSATAEVTYHAFREVQTTLSLHLVDGSWRVDIPEIFRISLDFDASTVAEVVIREACTVPVVGASVDIVAWPDTYMIEIVDPTGVLGERYDTFLYMGTFNEGAMGTRDPAALQAVPDLSLTLVTNSAAGLLIDELETCRDSGFTDASCPPGIVGADTSTSELHELFSGYYGLIDRIWTDDSATWRFETKPATISVSFDGVPTDVTFTTTGTLSTDNQGNLIVTLDAQ